MRKFKNTPIVNYSFIESKAKEYENAGWRRLKRCHAGAIATLARERMRINILPSNAETFSSTKR